MPYPATQTGWNDAAADYGGTVKVCGCKSEILTGKKLYRLVNYFLELTTGGSTDEAPDYPGTWPGIGTVYWNQGPTQFPYPALIFTGNPGSTAGIVILQSGLGLDNPILAINPAPTLLYAVGPGDPYDAWIAAIQDGLIEYCVWSSVGAYLGTFRDPVTIQY